MFLLVVDFVWILHPTHNLCYIRNRSPSEEQDQEFLGELFVSFPHLCHREQHHRLNCIYLARHLLQ